MKESSYWRCPECGEYFESETLPMFEKCLICKEPVCPYYNEITWEEFAAWCRELKNG